MWIFLNDAFISVVQQPRQPDHLLVRARLSGDLSRAFPGVKLQVTKTPDADYRFRTTLPRRTVAEAIGRAVMQIDYGNFKDSVPKKDKVRSTAYLRCWSAMNEAQVKTTPKRERELRFQNLFPGLYPAVQ